MLKWHILILGQNAPLMKIINLKYVYNMIREKSDQTSQF